MFQTQRDYIKKFAYLSAAGVFNPLIPKFVIIDLFIYLWALYIEINENYTSKSSISENNFRIDNEKISW